MKALPQADCGGIYQRWDDQRGKTTGLRRHRAPGECLPRPGLWQKLHVEFQAPRFDAAGKNPQRALRQGHAQTASPSPKTSRPRARRGSGLQTTSAARAAHDPGDHGAIALRDIRVKRFERGVVVTVSDLHCKLYQPAMGPSQLRKGEAQGRGFRRVSPWRRRKSSRFALIFTGWTRRAQVRIASPSRAGATARLHRWPARRAAPRSRQPARIITLTAGKHEFRADLVHATNSRPPSSWWRKAQASRPMRSRPASPVNRPGRPRPAARRLQQDHRRRAHRPHPAPAWVRAVRAAQAPLRRVRRLARRRALRLRLRDRRDPARVAGRVHQHRRHVGRPWQRPARAARRPALTFNAKPTIALIEYAQNGDWPDEPDALWSSQATRSRPTAHFSLSKLAGLNISDRVAPARMAAAWSARSNSPARFRPGPPGCCSPRRRPSRRSQRRLARGRARGSSIGPDDAAPRPVLRSMNGHQQLAVPLSAGLLEKPLSYSIVW